MKTDKFIDITIDDTGKIVAVVNGIEGPKCSDASKFLDTLGTVEVDSKTADYNKGKKSVLTVGS